MVAVCLTAPAIRQRVVAVLGGTGAPACVLHVDELARHLLGAERVMAVVDIEVLDRLGRDPVVSVSAAPWPASLVLIVEDEARADLRRALRLGAGALLLSDRIATLPSVLAVAREGHLCVPSSLRQPLSRAVLSHREREALALAISGLTNAEVARCLYVAPSTVKSHLSAAFHKLGVRSRAEAAALVHDPDEGLAEMVLGALPLGSGARLNGRHASVGRSSQPLEAGRARDVRL
jgi:DNA-binding NarL/FixJ family response regulator